MGPAMSVLLASYRCLAECLGIHNASEEITRDSQAGLQSEVDLYRDKINLLQQENDELKRGSHVLTVSTRSLNEKYEQVQQQLGRELQASGSYAEGSANPSLLKSTVKDLIISVSGLAKAANLADSPLVDHCRRLKTNCEFEPMTQFRGAFLTRPAHAIYVLEACLFDIFMRDFENDSFRCGGTTSFLDPDQRKAKSFLYFQAVNTIDLNDSIVSFNDSDLEAFCVRKFRDLLSLWQSSFACNSETGHDHDPHACKLCLMYKNGLQESSRMDLDRSSVHLIRSFTSTAKMVWALHKLCLSFEPRADVFRVESGFPFEKEYMDSVANKEDDEKFVSKVGFMISPGFRLRKSLVKCQIYLAKPPEEGYQV